MRGISRACVAAALICIGSVSLAEDWSQYRGPNRDGKPADFKARDAWPRNLTLKWQVEVGDGVATPALVDDRLYVFTRVGGNEVVSCLNADTGAEVWSDRYPAQGASGPAAGFSGPRATPAVANGKVITLGVRGRLTCYDAAKGNELWRKDDTGGVPQFFTSASPLIDGNLCITQVGGRDGAIVALDLATGNEKWRWSGDGTAYASPVLITVGSVRAIVAETDRRIVAVNLADGKLLWETPFAVSGRGYNAATPSVEGQTIVYTGSSRGTHAVKFSPSGAGISATVVWSNRDSSAVFASPVLKDGHAYGLTQGNELFCLSADTGRTAWSTSIAGDDGGRGGRGGGRGGYGSIVDAGGVMFALTPAAELIAFKPGPKSYAELYRVRVAGSPTYAYPIVTGNRIYIKDQDTLALWTVE